MLALSPIEYSHQSEDKGFDLSAQSLEDPFSDLFDQYIKHESFDFNDNVNDLDFFADIDIPTDPDTSSSGSYAAEPKANDELRVNQEKAHPTSSSEVPLQQGFRTLVSRGRPRQAISGVELLSLEGKSAYQETTFNNFPSPPKIPVIPSTTTPLRRKPKFSVTTPETLLGRTHRVSKSPCRMISESSRMMRPSYYYRHEMPSSHEWTQRFEQINLDGSASQSAMAPRPSETVYQRENTNTVTAPGHRASCELLSEKEQVEEKPVYSHRRHGSLADDFNALTIPQKYTRGDHQLMHDRRRTSYDHHHAFREEVVAHAQSIPRSQRPSIRAEPSMDEYEFTVSPSQIQRAWPGDRLQTSDSFYQDSTPVLAQADTDLAIQGLMIQCDPFDNFIGEDPSESYLVTSADSFQLTELENYPPDLSPTINQHRPRTPSSRSSSTSPSPSTPSKARRRSRVSRRKSSSSTPKTPRTPKTPSFGFVNFTPNDSQKILGGVAPSGSSKTQARREQEANEKRRKMSQAALTAVTELGGDPEKLKGDLMI
ncbi:hypothetical protein MMC12_002571 [Toensbergia leucococca]|nr:hypothetical protein [Toensbergia leucococca]